MRKLLLLLVVGLLCAACSLPALPDGPSKPSPSPSSSAPSPSTTSPTPAPSPSTSPGVKSADLPTSTAFHVTAWNERSFPAMTSAQYDHDLLSETASGWVKAPALAYLGAEFATSTGEVQRTNTYAARHGWTVGAAGDETPGVTDTLTVISKHSWATVYTTHAKVIHGRSPGPSSPARRYVATWTSVNGFKVVFVALHFTNGCWPKDRTQTWYAARCQAVNDEAKAMTDFTTHEHGNGWTVVLGGDLNVARTFVFGQRQVQITPCNLMETAVVPADGVNARLGALKIVPKASAAGLFTDHCTPDVVVNLSRVR